jgi:hypothetical protein
VNRDLPNALIVKGDIFRPPLAPGFDLAYSVGVLHHTPDCHQAFLSTARLVRSGVELAVWLYPHARERARQIVEWAHERVLRPLTSHLPHTMLESLCGALGRVTVLKTRLKERGGTGREALARLLNLVAVGEHHDPQIAAFLNFDWYSPPYRARATPRTSCARGIARRGSRRRDSLPERVSASGGGAPEGRATRERSCTSRSAGRIARARAIASTLFSHFFALRGHEVEILAPSGSGFVSRMARAGSCVPSMSLATSRARARPTSWCPTQDLSLRLSRLLARGVPGASSSSWTTRSGCAAPGNARRYGRSRLPA